MYYTYIRYYYTRTRIRTRTIWLCALVAPSVARIPPPPALPPPHYVYRGPRYYLSSGARIAHDRRNRLVWKIIKCHSALNANAFCTCAGAYVKIVVFLSLSLLLKVEMLLLYTRSFETWPIICAPCTPAVNYETLDVFWDREMCATAVIRCGDGSVVRTESSVVIFDVAARCFRRHPP